ncbi:MAG: glycerol kinase, partial [Lachnospiraceae bacterium]|nr:glycerol kinase [Lachnospiraceae bacterium]
MSKYIMALDSGTTSVRCLIFDGSANVVSMSQRSVPQYFPQPGWVEQDANEIWARQL